MIIYPNSYFPGPTKVPENVLGIAAADFGSADVEPEFLELYNKCVSNLQTLYGTENDVLILTGEGMLALWGGLKSCLKKNDRVLCISTGLFGEGMKPMAESIGCNVRIVEFPYDCSFDDYDVIEQNIKEFRPKMITAVQCETPSGIMNDISVIGQLKKKYGIPLLYVDAVSALGGAPVDVDKNNIDICLGGAQKAISAPPNSCFASVSSAAWEIIEDVKYCGYDSFLDFKNSAKTGFFPYTPSWVNVAQIYKSTMNILDEGLENVFARHAQCARYVIENLKNKGYRLFPKNDSFSAVTVTAAYVPEGYAWTEWDRHLRERGLVVGGNYGKLAGKIFRIGHMGSQATMQNVERLCGLL